MKTKKILAITLSCLLLIGAMVGFTVSAAEGDPAVAISGVNVSYESAIKLVYTLDAANIPEGGAAKIVFSYDENVTVLAGAALDESAYEYVNDITVYGNDEAVFSDGFAPADMTKTIYAVPVVVDEGGTVVATGKKVTSSIYDYFMGRINGGSYTADQFALYVAALDFGGFVQAANKVTDGVDPVGGHYANEYYQLKKIDETGKVTAEAYSKPTALEITAPKGNVDGKLFDHFADKNGVAYENADFNKLTLNLNKIGTTYVEYVYGDISINVEGITGTASSSAALANPDTDVVVKGGAEYYLDANITLTAGAAAALDFMADDTVKIGTVNFSEAEGVVTVSDGVSSFTMANGANLKIEYTVISATANTGAIFYYVDGAYVAKSDITTDIATAAGLVNTAFSKVVASATAGEIAVKNVIVGANDGVVTFTTTAVSTVVYDYDPENGKYFWYKKTNDNADGGKFRFEIVDAVQPGATTVFEAKVKLTGNFIQSGAWRNAIAILGQTEYYTDAARRYNVINTNIAFSPSIFYYGAAANGAAETQFALSGTSIAADTWFDLKIEHVGSKSFSVYINGVQVYTKANGTSAIDILDLTPSSGGAGSIYMADVKYYSK